MNLENWNRIKNRYYKNWYWLDKYNTPEFVGKIEPYEECFNKIKKRKKFWNSKFWAWIKEQKMVECVESRGKISCNSCNIHDIKSYALHHNSGLHYYEPFPVELELLCNPCHGKEHFYFYNKRKNFTMATRNNCRQNRFGSIGFIPTMIENFDKNRHEAREICTEITKRREKNEELQKIISDKKIKDHFTKTNYPDVKNLIGSISGGLIKLDEQRKIVYNRRKRIKNRENSTNVELQTSVDSTTKSNEYNMESCFKLAKNNGYSIKMNRNGDMIFI